MPSASTPIDWESLSLRFTFAAITAVAIVFLVGPSLIVILTSLTASQSLRFPPGGLSLRWYAALLKADQMQQAAWTSLVVAAVDYFPVRYSRHSCRPCNFPLSSAAVAVVRIA